MALQSPLFGHLRHVEQLDRLIAASGDQERGIRGKSHRTDPIVHRFLKPTVVIDKVPACFARIIVVLFPVAVMQDFFLSAGQHLPELDLTDVRSTGEMYAVRRKGDADRPVMVVLVFTEESHELGAGGNFPDLDVLVVTPTSQHETIGREGKVDDIVVIACEEEFFRFAGLWVPEPNGPVLTGSGQSLSVRCEEDASDIRRVSLE